MIVKLAVVPFDKIVLLKLFILHTKLHCEKTKKQ